MKTYRKPLIVSEEVLERVALSCADYLSYTKFSNPCYEEYLGCGKVMENIDCLRNNS